MIEPSALQLIQEFGIGGAALFMLWRLSERIGAMAEGFATCSAKLDALIAILKKDQQP